MDYLQFTNDSRGSDPKLESFKALLRRSIKTLNNVPVQKEYIPNKYPPDIDFAQDHGVTTDIDPFESFLRKRLELRELQIQPIMKESMFQNEPLEYCCERLELAEFGTGYPLYFEFVIYCIVMLIIIFLSLGCYALYSNYETGDCTNSLANCDEETFINLISVPNKKFHPDEYYEQAWVNLGTVILVMISLHIFRRMQKATENECDRGVTSPSDYSVWLTGLPPGGYTENDIKQIFEEAAKIGGHNVFQIKKVVMAFELTNFMNNCQKISDLEAKIREFLKNEKKSGRSPGDTLSSLEIEKSMIQEDLQRFIIQAEQMDPTMLQKTTGDVFVIFDEQDDREFIEESFSEKEGWKNILCCQERQSLLQFQRQNVQVRRSPEPNDIIWQNLGFSSSYKLKRRVFTNFMTAIVLLICFFLILAISALQSELNEQAKIGTETFKYLVLALGYLGSFLIFFINGCLIFTLRKFATIECHCTQTEVNISVAEKLSFAQFCNTAIIIFFANAIIYSVDDIFCYGGLVSDLYTVFLCNSIIPVLTTYFNPWYGLRLYKRWKIEREGADSFVTQKEANQIYEGGPLDMAYKYGILVKTMWFTSFYACIMPIGILFSIINVTLTYFLDKYLILRRYARTPLLSSALNREMVESLEFCPFIMSVGSIFFHIYIYDPPVSELLPEFIAIGLTSINFIFPAAKINDIFFNIQDVKPDPTPYEQAQKGFVSVNHSYIIC